jgi:hypothetical protein
MSTLKKNEVIPKSTLKGYITVLQVLVDSGPEVSLRELYLLLKSAPIINVSLKV